MEKKKMEGKGWRIIPYSFEGFLFSISILCCLRNGKHEIHWYQETIDMDTKKIIATSSYPLY